MSNRVLVSPDKKHRVELIWACGEFHMGSPDYYYLTIDNILIKTRIFHEHPCYWSENSRYFVMLEICQSDRAWHEWESRWVLFDIEKKRSCVLNEIKKGFGTPIKFENTCLIYFRILNGKRIDTRIEINALNSNGLWTSYKK